MSPPSVCIVSHNGYGAISGAAGGFIGGVERQTSLLAKWLASQGHQVSFLTWDESVPDDEWIDGVRIIKICRKNAGLPGLRFFHPKWTGLVSALSRADANVYYHNCGECVTGQIALWCKRNGKAFVFSAANDTDCDLALPELTHFKDRFLYLRGLKAAHRVIVQTETQKTMMKDSFGISSMVIPMPSEGPCPPMTVGRGEPPSERVLWVARVCPQKRPDRLVELARLCPDLEFDMVGPHYPDPLSQDAVRAAEKEANIRVHGPLPTARISKLIRNAGCFVSTSDYEGFPNTFLESWSSGLPIVSTFDPDQVIATHEMGSVSRDTETLAKEIRLLLGNHERYRRASANALAYFNGKHSFNVVQPRFQEVILEAVQTASRK